MDKKKLRKKERQKEAKKEKKNDRQIQHKNHYRFYGLLTRYTKMLQEKNCLLLLVLLCWPSKFNPSFTPYLHMKKDKCFSQYFFLPFFAPLLLLQKIEKEKGKKERNKERKKGTKKIRKK